MLGMPRRDVPAATRVNRPGRRGPRFAALLSALAVLGVAPAVPGAAPAPPIRGLQQQNQLTVTIAGGLGRVTSEPAGIDCPVTCSAAFDATATVILTASAARGFRFDFWGGDGCSTTSGNVCAVTIGGLDREATANFRPRAVLQVVGVGQGTVAASPPGQTFGAFTGTSCELLVSEMSTCEFAFRPRTRVKLVATPEAGSRFVRWSLVGCRHTLSCALRLDRDYQSVAAVFSPLRLGVVASGTGRVATRDARIAIRCENDVCTDLGEYRAGARVVLTAASTKAIEWSGFCKPVRGDRTRCVAFVTNDPTWVGVRFGSAAPPDLPSEVLIRFRVLKGGAGRGRVRGEDIDCGARCAATYGFGARKTMTARPALGSRFVRWQGACGRRRVCSLPVGPVTSLRALFARRR